MVSSSLLCAELYWCTDNLKMFAVPLQIEHIHTAVLPILEARELEALQQRIRVLCPGVDPCVARTQEAALNILAQHSEEPLGFLQFFNLNK